MWITLRRVVGKFARLRCKRNSHDMKKIIKLVTYFSSLAFLTMLVFFSGLLSKFTQGDQPQVKKGTLANGFLNTFEPNLAKADYVPPSDNGIPSDSGSTQNGDSGNGCDSNGDSDGC